MDGEEVYASDIAGNPGEWFATSPDWKVEGGKLVQPNPSATSSILLQGRQFDARKAALVSVEFDATKLGARRDSSSTSATGTATTRPTATR